jgi:Big-like domain-containing protein/parallel beta helix pectate lyase-like protein
MGIPWREIRGSNKWVAMKVFKSKFWLPVLLATNLVWSGCGSSSQDFVTTGNPPNINISAPVAVNDAYTTSLNRALVVPAATGVLVNDSPNPIGGQPVLVTFQSTSVYGGQVTSTDNAGAFTYTPAPGFLGTDIFRYDLSNGSFTSRATVTVEVTPQGPGIFVDSRTGNDSTASATSGLPYATVQGAVNAAGPNADIIILPGEGTYTGQVQLLNGQRLLGTESALVNAQGPVRPTLSGPVILADGNTLDSLRVVRTPGICIDGDGQDSGTITNCEIADNVSGTGIQMRGVTGNWLVAGNTISQVDGIGLDLDTQMDGSAVIRVQRNTITGCSRFGLGVAAFGQSDNAVQITDNTLSANGIGLGPNGGNVGMLCGASQTATVCVQVLGNQNQGLYTLVPASTINFEQFAQAGELNSGTFVTLQGQVTDVAAGFCGF